jgi:long-chain acyl-CoA synthetase
MMLKYAVLPEGVPRVYQRIQQVVLQKFKAMPGPVRRIIYRAIREQTFALRKGKRIGILDTIIFNKAKKALGGRVRMMCTGSAPLSPEIAEFMKVCFGCPLVEGYGLTETGDTSNLFL